MVKVSVYHIWVCGEIGLSQRTFNPLFWVRTPADPPISTVLMEGLMVYVAINGMFDSFAVGQIDDEDVSEMCFGYSQETIGEQRKM